MIKQWRWATAQSQGCGERRPTGCSIGWPPEAHSCASRSGVGGAGSTSTGPASARISRPGSRIVVVTENVMIRSPRARLSPPTPSTVKAGPASWGSGPDGTDGGGSKRGRGRRLHTGWPRYVRGLRRSWLPALKIVVAEPRPGRMQGAAPADSGDDVGFRSAGRPAHSLMAPLRSQYLTWPCQDTAIPAPRRYACSAAGWPRQRTAGRR